MAKSRMRVSLATVGELALEHTPWTVGIPLPPDVTMGAVTRVPPGDFGIFQEVFVEISGDSVPDADYCLVIVRKGEDGVVRFDRFEPR